MSNALDAYIAKTDLEDPKIRDAYATALQDTAEAAGSGGMSDFTFLSFSGRRNAWSVSSPSGAVDYEFGDELFIALPELFTEGWIFWANGAPKDRKQWRVSARAEQCVDENDLPAHDLPIYKDKSGKEFTKTQDGWHKQVGMGIVIATADTLGDTGCKRSLSFSTNSPSGRNSVTALMREVGERISRGEPCYPVITIGSEQFTAQDNVNYKPAFAVQTWLTQDEVVAVYEAYSFDALNEDATPPANVTDAEVVEVDDAPPPNTPAPPAPTAKKAKAKAKASAPPPAEKAPADNAGGVPPWLRRT